MLSNTQPAAKKDLRKDGHVWIHSIFPTIQGEGPFAGTPCVFVRLAGCNLQCPFCDTEYTLGAVLKNPGQVTHEVNDSFFQKGTRGKRLVVITGGEPFRQNLYILCQTLLDAGFQIQIETNGTLCQPLPPSEWITVVCSPKTGSVHKSLWSYIRALKYVARHEDLEGSPDGLPAEALGHAANPNLARPPVDFKGLVYLQPVDENDPNKNHQNMLAVQHSCMVFGHTLCLQLHKIIGAP